MSEVTSVGSRVTEIMARSVMTIGQDRSVHDAARMLADHRFTGAPVVDDDGNLVGIVSETDIIAKKGQVVSDVMTPAVYSVDESATLGDVAEMLLTRHIRRVPVTRDGRLVGLVSRSDLLGFFANHEWVCNWCGAGQRGLTPPSACAACDSETFRLDRAGSGTEGKETDV